MLIHVTQKHIDNGRRKKCDKCPVSLALSEATGKEWLVTATHLCYTKWFSKNGWSNDIVTPTYVAVKVKNYDRYGVMAPFSFELEIS